MKSDETLLAILGVLRQRGSVGVTQIATELGLAKSTVHDHLQTLAQHDFVTRNETEYELGLRFLDYGLAARQNRDFFEASRDKINELAETTQERAWSIVEEHGHAVYLHGSVGRHSIQTREETGQRRPLHCLAAGKAILAYLPEKQIDAIVDEIGLDAQTEYTITERDQLAAELATVRDRGIAFNRQEMVEGVNAIAVPVLDSDGSVFGAISIGGPANRLNEDRLEGELSELLLGAANEIEINMRERRRQPTHPVR